MAKTYKELMEEMDDLECRIKSIEMRLDLLTSALKTAHGIFDAQERINDHVDRKLKTLEDRLNGDDKSKDSPQ